MQYPEKIIYPPARVKKEIDSIDVFLAGTIEMGKATDWQIKLGLELSSIDEVSYIYNPRRQNWDSSWKQSIDNPVFNEQVTWELDHIDSADLVFFNFVENTFSPITLAEFGLLLGRGCRPIICCPQGFWRKGNVDIMASRLNVKVFDNYDEAVEALKMKITGGE